MPKYRLRNGEIEVSERDGMLYFGKSAGGIPWFNLYPSVAANIFEPVPEPEPAPTSPPEPESERDTYIYAIRARNNTDDSMAVNYCFARSEDEATGIAYRECRRLWPQKAYYGHDVEIMKMEFEDT